MRVFGFRMRSSPRESFFNTPPEEDLVCGVSGEDVQDLRTAFYTAAKSGDGSIDGNELQIMLESLGYAPTLQQTDAIITEMNRSPGNQVSFDEFLVLMHRAGVETAFQAEIREVREVFNKYDRKKKGEVTRKELKKIVRHLCGDLAEEDAVSLVSRIEGYPSGRVSFKQFVASMYK